MLLRKKRLILKGKQVTANGCNGWKGRYYDGPIRELTSGSTPTLSGAITDRHIIAALALGYLAMVAECGYIVALTPSGLLMRRQFFSQNRFHRPLGLRHQMLLGGLMPTSADARLWERPFSFSFQDGACVVGARNFAILIPMSGDPHECFARRLRFVPSKFARHPDFATVFD